MQIAAMHRRIGVPEPRPADADAFPAVVGDVIIRLQ